MDRPYWAVHKWLARGFVKSHVCEECGKRGRTEWSNISGEYRRDRRDFRELCLSCHRRVDDNVRNLGDYSVKGAHPGAQRGFALANARKTHCKRGHPFTPENIYVPPSRPSRRYCLACRRGEAVG